MTDKSFVENIKKKLSPLGEVIARPMMGDYCLYLHGKLIGNICDNTLYLKKFENNKDFLANCPQSSPYPGAKPMYKPNVEQDEYLKSAVYLTLMGASVQQSLQKRK